MKIGRLATVLTAGLLPVALATANGCGGRDEEDETTTSRPAPTPTPPTPTATVTQEIDAGGPEDAGPADAAADADAARPKGTWDPSGLNACCAALASNAVNAPLDQKPLYAAAAGACTQARSSASLQAALAQIQRALGSAKMPPVCR
ncbi:MAG: acyltransferase [Polyangiaceae bacterium]|nr:acyltransferase [Polyangiaceae bacterium]